ncbi:MAG: hypothetical protein GY854_12195 [Deltaproteobacteria bacterium]|nr:hypothetical protein [Deltaproteobacteria bacterium]
MADNKKEFHLTGSLEDYLETIFELVRDHKLARVRDIARARGVKAGSVSPAMRRLSDLGLIKYIEREYIDLTSAGESEARRIYAKHQLLTRFFTKILGMTPEAAEVDACAMEHNLSDNGMDHLVRFFEFLQGCPEGDQFLNRFLQCSLIHKDAPKCDIDCSLMKGGALIQGKLLTSIWELKAGEKARVCQIASTGATRQHLLDMGIIPDAVIQLERRSPAEGQSWIKTQGFQLSLTREESESVIVVAL